MNVAVRYFTRTGNTKKLADAVAKEGDKDIESRVPLSRAVNSNAQGES